MESTELLTRVVDGQQRLQPTDALLLFRKAPLLELARAAHTVRLRRTDPRRVTFVIDTNPNYTNVCDTDCTFCAFYRKPGDPEGYTLTPQQVVERIAPAVRLGATTLLMQVGHIPALPLDYYLELIRVLHSHYPGLHLHLFSAPEIRAIATFIPPGRCSGDEDVPGPRIVRASARAHELGHVRTWAHQAAR